MTEIEINNLTDNFFDEKLIKSAILSILETQKSRLFEIFSFNFESEEELNCSVSIVIVGPKRMRKFNKQHRNRNKITDVLSFSLGRKNKESSFIDPVNSLGEIMICSKYIKKIIKRKKQFNKSNLRGVRPHSESSEFEEIFLSVLIHGVLHLLGYNHKQMAELKIVCVGQTPHLGSDEG